PASGTRDTGSEAQALPDNTRIVLRDAAVSTSGDAEQWLDVGGVRYSHIIDPHTGMALTGRRAVTVVARQGALADGLATAVSVMGPAAGLDLVNRTAGCAARFSITQGGEVRTMMSSRWPAYLAAGASPCPALRCSPRCTRSRRRSGAASAPRSTEGTSCRARAAGTRARARRSCRALRESGTRPAGGSRDTPCRSAGVLAASPG